MNKKEELKILRHSAAHLAAHAINELYPDTKFTIGPATEDGFFYDILPTKNLKEEDLPLVEQRMHEISQRNLKIDHKEIAKDEARKIFKDNIFKLELIDQIPGDTVGLSTQGDFKDLCRGGHVGHTGDIKFFKLIALSGSYWRADRSNQVLQRVHGTAFLSKEDMEEHEKLQEDLLKYDHRKIGKQLDLFSFHQEGIGFPFFHPRGKKIINVLVSYMRKLHDQNNYSEISTPTILNQDLWKKSGHYDFYKDNMYFTTIDEQINAIKPMNCPGAFLVYGNRPRSYRELPLKLAEFGHVHRHELSGVLHGLLRVRAFTQDDAHIFCTVDQIKENIVSIMDIAFKVLSKCDFKDIKLAVSTKPKNAMGSDLIWQQATDSLKAALDSLGHKYEIKEGEGAFYGPKIEIVIQDSMKREWQCGTVQVDFVQSENFDLTYVSSSGTHERPVIIHQAIYGSLERFFAILLEHFKGNLPFWLSPVQAKILTITDEQKEYAQALFDNLKKSGFRVEMDETSDPISGKIKSAQLEKVPWMVVIGKKEVENNTYTLRYNDGKQKFGLTLDELIAQANEINSFNI